jgi:hypothetical protein
MDTATALAFPMLRRFAIGFHLFAAGWILLNGIAHSAQVLWKARQGTLAPEHDLMSMLLIGAGLIVSAAALSLGAPGLLRQGAPAVLPAALGLGLFALVIGGIAARYGFTFLVGSITILIVDSALLTAHRLFNGGAA